jgi:hypothetical protein
VHLRQNDGSSPPNDVGFPQDESEAPGRHGTPVYNGPAQFANRKEFTPPDCAPGDKRCGRVQFSKQEIERPWISLLDVVSSYFCFFISLLKLLSVSFFHLCIKPRMST